MEDKFLRSSADWEKIYRVKHGILLQDLNGWDNQDLHYSFNIEKISEEEFNKRLSQSKTYDIQNKKNS